MRNRPLVSIQFLMAITAVFFWGAVTLSADDNKGEGSDHQDSQGLSKIKHFVIIYEENHSFDNLYGGWEGVNGVSSADFAHTLQVGASGIPYTCLQDNFASALPLPSRCIDSTTPVPFESFFFNEPFVFDDFFPNTTPTADMTHRFYQEQYQIDGGKQDRYVTGNVTTGLTMGIYDTKQLPIYLYLHQDGHPHYAILDNFFHAAYGGTMLNHQFLIAARAPVLNPAANDGGSGDLHSAVDANGMPVSAYPLYPTPQPIALGCNPPFVTCPDGSCAPSLNMCLPPPPGGLPPPPGGLPPPPAPPSGGTGGGPTPPSGGHPISTAKVNDNVLSISCNPPVGALPTPPGLLCGDYLINNATLTSLSSPTIADRFKAAGIDWSWYSGGFTNSNGPIDTVPFTFFASFAPPSVSCPSGLILVPPFALPPGLSGNYCVLPVPNQTSCPPPFLLEFGSCFIQAQATPAGPDYVKYLRDETEFQQIVSSSTKNCQLKPVSFVKPEINEHPGQNVAEGDSHLVSLIQAVESSECAEDTMIIITYDENGGSWDHVSPPGQGGTPGPHDAFGPGTRVPALVIAPHLKGEFVVDHTQYDTTSILSTLELKYHLAPLGTRDAAVNDLSNVFHAKSPDDQ